MINLKYRKFLRHSRFLFLPFGNQSQGIKTNSLTLIKNHNSFPHYLSGCTWSAQRGRMSPHVGSSVCTQMQQGLSPTQFSGKEGIISTAGSHLKADSTTRCRTKNRTWPRATACEKLNKNASSKQFRKLVGGFPFFWVIIISSRQQEEITACLEIVYPEDNHTI